MSITKSIDVFYNKNDISCGLGFYPTLTITEENSSKITIDFILENNIWKQNNKAALWEFQCVETGKAFLDLLNENILDEIKGVRIQNKIGMIIYPKQNFIIKNKNRK
jgi:hypothetical protein